MDFNICIYFLINAHSNFYIFNGILSYATYGGICLFDTYIKSVPRHKKEFQEFINKFAAATGFFKICNYTFTFFSWIENFNVNKIFCR